MNSQQKIRFLWKCFRFINKKFHNNKLVLNKIELYNRKLIVNPPSKKLSRGVYLFEEKRIVIYGRLTTLRTIMVFCHELAHAYQRQLKTKYYDKKREIAQKNKKRLSHSQLQKIVHDDIFFNCEDKYLHEISKNITNIKVKWK